MIWGLLRSAVTKNPTMLRNQITTILRRLKQDRIYSAINIAGLALGLACVIFVFLIVMKEYSVNRLKPTKRLRK